MCDVSSSPTPKCELLRRCSNLLARWIHRARLRERERPCAHPYRQDQQSDCCANNRAGGDSTPAARWRCSKTNSRETGRRKRGNKAEGKSGKPGDKGAGKGCEKKQRKFEIDPVHCSLHSAASSACMGSPISRGDCDTPDTHNNSRNSRKGTTGPEIEPGTTKARHRATK